jgi:hypothetical protein
LQPASLQGEIERKSDNNESSQPFPHRGFSLLSVGASAEVLSVERKPRYRLDPGPSAEVVDPRDSDFSLMYRPDLILGICIAPYCEI